MRIKTLDVINRVPTPLGETRCFVCRFYVYDEHCEAIAKNAISEMRRTPGWLGELLTEKGEIFPAEPHTTIRGRAGNSWDIVKSTSKLNVLFCKVFLHRAIADTIQRVLGGTIVVGQCRPLFRVLK